jgi:uncharacterized membrane protein YqiK
LVFLLGFGVLKAFVKVGRPDQTMVITGKSTVRNNRKFGFTVERGRTTVTPFFQHLDFLDLGVMPLNVKLEGVNSANGITVGADATACVCIDADDESMLYSAVERLMGKTRVAIQEQLQQTLVGNFRGALNKATPLQAIGMDDEHEAGERAQFRNELMKDINSDLSHFGVRVVSVSLQKIWDTSNYIANLAQKTLARKRQEVEIQEAKLKAQADQAESDSARRIFVAKNTAGEKILAARRKLQLFERESEGAIRKAALEADSSIQEAENRAQRQVQELRVVLNTIQNKTGVTLEAEARRQAATCQAEGDYEAARLVEEARNKVLETKAKLLSTSADGSLVLFIQQQLPQIYEVYQERTKASQVDQYVVLENENGFNDAVNRGPAAFVDFLSRLEAGFGISVKGYFATQLAQGGKK